MQEHIQHIVQTSQVQTFPTPITTLVDCNRDDFAAYQLFIKPLYGCLRTHTHTHTYRDIYVRVYTERMF